ncbi:DUF6587 family protein [Coralloluteibacterium stylophorae]|uniref:Uncharacterized protein n=1 Tax=Coralloluteibacterium stylophorae TaxID=1776034 RepID=A0A8J8B099_9GAMM|nr:DUF6587 family protein [Coralloluteibacterium stylophorae]MBS7456211.1 hypothetical protein [Coralloluteibacterium stylophorae]
MQGGALYAVVEALLVGAVVAACLFALLLRWLPRTWLRAPLGRFLDRPRRPAWLRRIGAGWHAEANAPGCASGCSDCSPHCAAHPGPPAAPRDEDPERDARRIPLQLRH